MKQKFFSCIPYFIILIGFLLRLNAYVHNRSLILDEANVAKNLYERDMASLFTPLSYAQFAPPIFLCAEKVIAYCLGYGELALRLVPFMCSVLSLWLLYQVLRRLMSNSVSWYPLLLMAAGYLFIRYASELKQYSSDVMIASGLLLLALKVDILTVSRTRFTLIWAVAGSLAVWSSMPAVFILCGAGAYYLYISVREGKSRVLPLIFVSVVWTIQFVCYYRLILGHDSNSAYLQNWHDRYFLIGLPRTFAQLQHNVELSISILSAMGGHTVVAIAFHLCLIIAGLIHLFRRNMATALLLFLPLLCLLAACTMHKFTLLPRVILFSLPLLLILAGLGLQQAFSVKSLLFKGFVTLVGLICAVNYCQFQYFVKPFEIEEFKDGLTILQQQKIDGRHVHVDFLSVPVYEYYIVIHPKRAKWSNLAAASYTSWNTNHDSLVHALAGTHAFLYEWCDEDRFNRELATDRKYSKNVTVMPFKGGNVVVLEK